MATVLKKLNIDEGEGYSHTKFILDLISTMYSLHVKHVIMFMFGSITSLDCW